LTAVRHGAHVVAGHRQAMHARLAAARPLEQTAWTLSVAVIWGYNMAMRVSLG